MPIRQLPQDVAAKIAAGEVVERPASVVKELIENALDAGAHSIRVELAGGGLELIRVTDDGNGIAPEELQLAFARHATSKIGSLGDLERLATLGFRGEALASIAAIARVTLTSRPRGADSGAQIAVDAGAMSPVQSAGAPAGTSIAVRGLFASVPARLKFLKTRATETGHCLHLLERYALACPEVRFTATSEGRQALATQGDGKLFSVLVAVYGLQLAEQMVPLGGGEHGDATPPGIGMPGQDRPRVSGYVSRPSSYKATRQYLSFFVNRRWVQSRTLSYAVEEAYHSLLLTGRHPIAAINIEMDPADLDVNVHPAKTEVKFLRERLVYATVTRAVRAAVLATAETPEVSSRSFAIPTWAGTESAQTPPADGSGMPDVSNEQAELWQGIGHQAGVAAPRGATGGFAVPGVAPDEMVGGRKLPVLRVLG
ncbi:MAG TPA: DNA mismatch repair endonuclease MutL, partial [Ktedonobacterales bacterium]|nr:DNA mismatch repair endonuclease MutL [Ktedonobacterales bacterium]